MPSVIQEYLKGKVIFITGATGFLAKGLVEKTLRCIPDVGKIYILIRPQKQPDGSILFAEQRLEHEVLGDSVFNRFRESHPSRFHTIRRKVVAVPGDLTTDRLGFDPDLYNRLTEEVQIVINSAATVVFDERLDHALEMNTLAPQRIMEFAMSCREAIFLHVSTAYVNGQREGSIPEALLPPDQTIAQHIHETDIKQQFSLEREIHDIRAFSEKIYEASQDPKLLNSWRKAIVRQNGDGQMSEERVERQIETMKNNWIEQRLIEEGMRRAQRYGWHDSYTFTKGMGEQLIIKHRGDLPVVIIRPAIIESSLEEPEPGWINGLKVADPLIVAYGKGRLPNFPAKPNIVVDLIPVDIVVNVILAALLTAKKDEVQIYQVATGTENPITFSALFGLIRTYFQTNPMRDKEGNPIRVENWTYPGKYRFRILYHLRYILPLDIVRRVMDYLPSGLVHPTQKRRVAMLRAVLSKVLYYTDIYSPYTNLKCRFQTNRTRALFESLPSDDQRLFNFDVHRIRWPEYIQDIHIPGLKRHVLKSGDTEESLLGELPEEKDREPETWTTKPEVETINDLLSWTTARYPDKVAFQAKRGDGWLRYTYRDVQDLAYRIGSYWLTLGLKPGDRVFLYSENRPEWGVAYCAAAAMGVTVIPIDQQIRAQEIWSLAELTEARAILASDVCFNKLSRKSLRANSLSPSPVHILNIDNFGLPFGHPAMHEPPPREGDFSPPKISPDATASIIFTSTVVNPRGVMLSHRNFMSDLLALAEVQRAYDTDQFLSVLPLHHTLEFTGGFLMPIFGGATITYVETLKSRVIIDLMRETGTTCLLTVPRIFTILFDRLQRLTRAEGENTVVKKLRLLVSGGAALPPEVYDDYQSLGLTIYEGYGLTETAPILTVNPIGKSKKGSVGKALPGIKLKIDRPNKKGEGEIVVGGPNVMSGYYKNKAATDTVLRDGWLYTGDLGSLDEEGYLFITGRCKNLIVTGAGKNVYPEEVEFLYRDLPWVKELCVLGMKSPRTLSEEVHAVAVLNTNGHDSKALRDRVFEAAYEISQGLPAYQRIHRMHLWEEPLPRLVDGRIDHQEVQARLKADRLEAVKVATDGPVDDTFAPWERETHALISHLTGLTEIEVAAYRESPLETLIDSLMGVELAAALEQRFGLSIPDDVMLRYRTLQDVMDAVETHRDEEENAAQEDTYSSTRQPTDTVSYWSKIFSTDGHQETSTTPEAGLGQEVAQACLWAFGGVIYRIYFDLRTFGHEHLPQDRSFLIAANHCSHLDSPAILLSTRKSVDRLYILGAKDYFFNTALKSWFFRTFLNATPFDRHGNFSEGLIACRSLLGKRRPLLIFPEGTRSITGQIQKFKIGLGVLALELNVPVVPAYIDGTYASFPKGKSFPKKGHISVTFGPLVETDAYLTRKGTINTYRLYQEIVDEVQARVEDLKKIRS
ncbi:MAG: AMP-binding protein [Candidatus Latescibacteria bacterium]|nr:AMP-binding protein [Candidatus Latescibacterota bacterium]